MLTFWSTQGIAMILFPILGAADTSAALDDAVWLQAARCGLESQQVVKTVDAQGKIRVSIKTSGDVDGRSFEAIRCMVEWALQSGVRVGFVSDPSPSSRPKS